VWAFLHFPLHLALVLAVEGAAQSSGWRAANIEYIALGEELNAFNLTNPDTNTIYAPVYNYTAAQWQSIASTVNDTFTNVMNAALTNSKNIDSTYKLIGNIQTMDTAVGLVANGSQSHNATLTAVNALSWTYYTLELAALELAGFEAASNSSDVSSDFDSVDFDSQAVFDAINEESNKSYSVFVLAFTYFFVAIGLVVVICTAIAALSKKEKRAVHYVRLAISGCIGLVLCFIALMAVDSASW